MNKLFTLLIFACLDFCYSYSQNLVPNPSFEQFSLCPSNFNQVTLATGWQKSLNNNTPQYHTEYLNACSSSSLFQVPSNTWGFQAAFSGQAYMALNTMAPSVFTNYRENIYIQLSSPLVAGQQYKVKMHASHTDNSKFVTNNLGIKFSTTANFPVNNISHIYSSTIISTNTNWDTIQGIFIADSAYQYLAIGNFFTDANTTRLLQYSGASYSLDAYFIDDVSVSCIAPIATISGNTSVCQGDSITLTANGGVTYLWNTGSIDSVISVKPSNTTMYTVVAKNGSCSSVPDTVIVTVLQPPNFNLIGDSISCNSSSVQLIAVCPTAQTTHWSPGILSTNDTITISSNIPGYFSAYVFDGTCKSQLDSIWVDTLSSPTISANFIPLSCINDTVQFSSVTNATSLVWNFGHTASGASNTSNLPNPSHIYTSAGNFTINLVAQNYCGSTSYASPITVQVGPQVQVPNDTSICKGQSVNLIAAGGTNYVWDGAISSNASSVLVAPLVTSTYIVKASNGTCFGIPDTIVVNPIDKPIVLVSGIDTVCNSELITLTATGASTYFWNGASGTSVDTIQVAPNVNSTYSVVGAIGACLSDTSFFKVTVSNISHADYSYSLDTCSGEILFLNKSSLANSYKWIFGDSYESSLMNPVHTYSESGTFQTMLITNPAKSCSDTLIDEIKYEHNPEGYLFIPNAFTPDGDGLNDVFTINSFHNCKLLKLEIYDRWGVLIFQNQGYQVSWNGRSNGFQVPVGVYVYVVNFNDTEKRGSITLFR